jgi:Protein of unknown function (DUF2723)
VPRTGLLERIRAGANAGNVAAITSSLVALVVYARTVLPGVSYGDWGDAQLNLYRLGILHPTGYPLYSLLGKAFTSIPIGEVAWRANLFSGVAAAAAVGIAVLILLRLGVRPVIAAGAGLALAFTGTLWQEATFAEMNSLHLLLVALVLHRALVWRAERRTRDLLLGALLAGLTISNHGLAITVVPIVVLWVLVDARREIAADPWLLVRSGAALVLGLLPYLCLPLRASFGPADVYGQFLDWNGFFYHVSGAQFRGAMKFTDPQDIAAAFAAMPGVVDDIVSLSNPVFLIAGLAGIVVLTARNRWFGSMLVVLGAVNIYFYANYNGDLAHYLLATWLILAIGLGYIAEAVVARFVELLGPRAGALAWVIALMPVVLLVSNFASHDQSQNQDAKQFTDEVFDALPKNAVLVTYWDALTALSYEHCTEGKRADVSLRAYDEAALVICDPVPKPLTEVVKTRPVYALQMFPDDVLRSTGLVPEPVGSIKIPWGKRYAEYDRPLLKLVPPDQAP